MTIYGFAATDLRRIWNFLVISIRDRYLGSRLGLAWAVLNPLLIMAVFTWVFGFIFKTRLPGIDTHFAYTVWLICGLASWVAVSEALNTAASSVVAAGSLIKNVAFKTEILPVVAVLTSLVTLAVSLVYLLFLMAIDRNMVTWHVVFLLPVLVVQYLFLAALGGLLATFTVFYRDIAQIIPTILQVIMFTSPIIYPIQSLPAVLRALAKFNPFYIIAEGFRDSIINHKVPDLVSLLALAVVSALLARVSVGVFRRAKGQFEAFL